MRSILVSTLALLLIACGSKEPGSRAAIENDLEDRPVRELYEEAEEIQYTPPSDSLLTDEHIKNYVRVRELGAEITKVAGEKLDREIESASRTDDRFTRMATAFAGLGSLRAALTAELRAALMLDLNPHEFLWVATEIERALPAYQTLRRYDEQIERTQAALDAETDSILRERKRELVEQATREKKQWLNQTGDVTLANARMIATNRAALEKFHRGMGER